MSKRSLHLFRNLDPQQLEALRQYAGRQLAKRQARAARRLFGFQHRAGFVKRVEAVGQLEEIIRQDVRPEVVQNRWNDFAKLTEPKGESLFLRRVQRDLRWRDKFLARLPENRADADIRVL